MANEIYHRSNWGNAVNDNAWGDVYEKFDATNEMFVRSDYYENSNETDKLMAAINPKPSILLTPTAYDNGSLHSVKPVKTFGDNLNTNLDYTTFGANSGIKTVTNGIANISSTGANSFTILSYQNQGLIAKGYNQKYKVSGFIRNISATNVYVAFYNGSTQGNIVNAYSGNEFLYFEVIITTGSSGNQELKFNSSVTGANQEVEFKDISIQHINDADFDFTRGSSATRVNAQGLVESVTDTNLPRIDYTGGTGSLLLEPQSTNLITQSNSNFIAGSNNLSISYNNSVSPTGENNAIKLTATSTDPYIQRYCSSTNTTFTLTVYAKGVGNSIGKNCNFFLVRDNYAEAVQSSALTLTNQWQRFEATLTLSTAPTINVIWRFDCPSAAEVGDEVLVFGAQIEALSYATSYIPTNGSTVTRLADVCNNSASSDLINSTEGVLYAEIAALANDGTYREISLNDGTINNAVEIRYTNTDNLFQFVVRDGGSVSVNSVFTLTNVLEFNKIAFSYKNDDYKMYIDGIEVATDTSGTTPSGLNRLSFNWGGSNPFYGKVKSLAVFKEALSNDQLERLTGEGYESFNLLAQANNYTII